MTLKELIYLLDDLTTHGVEEDAEVFVFDVDCMEYELVTGVVFDHDTVTLMSDT